MANGRGVRPKVCKVCGREGTDESPISFRGLCADDSIRRMVAYNVGLAKRSGPEWDAWKERMRKIVGD